MCILPDKYELPLFMDTCEESLKTDPIGCLVFECDEENIVRERRKNYHCQPAETFQQL